MKTKKGLLLIGGLVALGLTLGLLACAPTPQAAQPGPGAPPTEGKTPPTPTPKRGGTVVYACIAGPNTLNPYVTAGAPDRRGMGPIYESLISFKFAPGFDYRADFEVGPWLAESWEQPDTTTYIFKIRKGVKWQDGEEFTAEDVAFSYNYGLDPKSTLRIAGFLKDIDEVEVLDKYTVKIKIKGPSPQFLINLADLNTMILSKHVYDQGGDFAKVAIGTGPFKLKEFNPVKASIFTRNENYWQAGKPYPDGVECLYGLDASARAAAFVSKKIDLLNTNDRPQLDSVLKSLPEVKYAAITGNVGSHLFMKLDKPPFNDVRVRKAMHLAVDRQSLVKIVTFGEGVIDPPGMIGTKQGWAIPPEELLKLPGYRQPKDEDLAEAKRLLSEAGYPNGFKSPLLYSTAATTAAAVAEPVVMQIKKVGIEFAIETTTEAEYLEREKRANFDAVLSVAAANLELRYQKDYFHSKGVSNKFGINDPKLDELLDTIYNNLNLETRKKAALEMQRLLLEKMYAIPTIELSSYALWQPWVHDYVYSLSNATFVDIQTASRFWLDVNEMPSDRR